MYMYMYTEFHALTLYSAVKPSCLIMDLKASKRPLYLTRSRDSPPSWTRGMDRIHVYTYMHVPNYLTNHSSCYTCTCIIIIITYNLVLQVPIILLNHTCESQLYQIEWMGHQGRNNTSSQSCNEVFIT